MKREDLVEIDEAEAHAFLDYVADVLKEQFGFERASWTVTDTTLIRRSRPPALHGRRGRRPDRGPGGAVAADGDRSTPPTAASSPNCCNGASIRTTCSSRWSTRQWRPRARRSCVEPGEGDQAGRCDDPLPVSQHEHSAARLRSRDRRHSVMPAGRLSRSVAARTGRRRPPDDALQPRRVLHQKRAKNLSQQHKTQRRDRCAQCRTPRPAKADGGSGWDRGSETREAPRGTFVLRPFVPFDPMSLPPRQWLYGKHYQRRTVSATHCARRCRQIEP